MDSNIADFDMIQPYKPVCNSNVQPDEAKNKTTPVSLVNKAKLTNECTCRFSARVSRTTAAAAAAAAAPAAERSDTVTYERKRHLSDTVLFSRPLNFEYDVVDKTMRMFLACERSGRRMAICSKIDKIAYNRQLINYMEYLLREDYIRNFLL